MAVKKVWIGKWGPYQYESTDTYSDSGETVESIRIEGQMLVETAPTDDNHVARLQDLSDVTFLVIDVADITDPSTELAAYDSGDAHCIIARQVRTELLGLDYFIIFVPDDAYTSGNTNMPYQVDGATGCWEAVAGRYQNGPYLSALEVAGITTFEGSVTVATGANLAVIDNQTIGGTLGVTGNSTLGGTLAVTGTSVFTGAVSTTAGLTVGTALTVAEDRVTRVITAADLPYDANLNYNKSACAYVAGGGTVSIRCPIPYMAVGDVVKHVTLLAAVNDGTGSVTATIEDLANGDSCMVTPRSTAAVAMTDQASNNLTVEEADVDITVTDNQAYGLYLVLDGGASGIAAFGGLFVDIETRNY